MKLSIKNSNVSRSTQELALIRALQFLRAVGTDANIMEALKQTGFDEAAQKQGWALVLTAYAAANGPAAAGISDAPINEAISKVESWQSAMFTRAHAALRRFHPDQDTFVFTNLVTGSGIAAVPSVSTFLDRLDALESSADRKATRKADHASLETLAQRGVTKEQRKEMRTLVKWVETTTASPLSTPIQSPREAALLAVYDWVQDWSDCARTVVTRRDQLIRLGIGKRRSRKQDAQPDPTPAPIVAIPVVPASPTDSASTSPVLVQAARAAVPLLPARTNGATPGSSGVNVNGGNNA
jgi:hypothetical protein